MAAVLNNAFLEFAARVIHAVPSLDELLDAMNREDGLRDGSRFL